MEVVLRTDTSESLQIIIIAVTCMLFYVILNTRNSPFDHENSCHLLIIRPNFPKRPVKVIEQISLLFLLDAAMSKYRYYQGWRPRRDWGDGPQKNLR